MKFPFGKAIGAASLIAVSGKPARPTSSICRNQIKTTPLASKAATRLGSYRSPAPQLHSALFRLSLSANTAVDFGDSRDALASAVRCFGAGFTEAFHTD